MKAPRNQLFLERRSYRQRRCGDAARMLPVLGLLLCLLPMFWGPDTSGEPRQTAWDGMYLFVIWALLIVIAVILSRRLTQAARTAEKPGERHEGTLADQSAGE
ncbi:MAG: hypothetical protein ACRCS3_06290 [Paracoccaceae bacterium]